MDKTVDLVNQWAEFRKSHPDADIEDFCRYFLIKKRESIEQEPNKSATKPAFGPPNTNARLMKIIGRIAMAHNIYLRIALKETEIKNTESFYFLANLMVMQEMRKTDLIYGNMTELSTGIDILNKLIKLGYISERHDPNDKRSRLVKITQEGREVVIQCFKKTAFTREIIFGELAEDDKLLIISLLEKIEQKHCKLALESKNKSIEEIYNSLKQNN